jgi:hypothetical protein
MTKKKKKQNFDEFREMWIESQGVDLAEVLSVPGVIELVLEYYNNDILKDYEDYCDEQLTHEEFQAKYYYR